MKSYQRRILLVSMLLALVGGCSSLSRQPTVELTDIDNGTPLHIVSVVVGEATVSHSAPKAKGWFAKINSKKSSKASEPAPSEMIHEQTPLQSALSGVDLGQVMIYELNASFRKGKPFDVQNIHGPGQPVQDVGKYFDSVPENALLALNTRYRFAEETQILVVETNAELYVKSGSGKGKSRAKPVYTNRIVAQLDMAGTPENGWAKAVQQSMQMGLKEVAQLVAMDLGVAQRWESQSEKQTWTSAESGKKLKGFQVQRHDGRIIIRLNNGELVSLPKDKS